MPRLVKLLPLLAAAALLAAACSEADQAQQEVNDDPENALESALDNLADYQGTSLGFSIEGSADSLIALSENELTDKQAQQILDSSLRMTSKEAEDINDQQAEFSATIAGQENALEIKTIGTTLYARADVSGLIDTFGGEQANLEALARQAATQPGFEFIGTLLDGDWIAVTGAAKFAEQLTGQSVEEQTEQQQAMAEELANSLKENAEVEAGDKEGPGGHVVVTLPLRALVEDFKEITQAAGTLASGGAPLPDADELPDEDIILDVWIDDEEVTQVELDIIQFADWEEADDFPEGVDDLRLRMSVAEFTGSVDEPDAAAEVDVSELMGLLMGGGFESGSGRGLPGGGAEGSEQDDVCAEIEAALEGQPDEVIEEAAKQYGDLCPNLGG
jgi:hypothetical protein